MSADGLRVGLEQLLAWIEGSEWTAIAPISKSACCPVCHHVQVAGHLAECWMNRLQHRRREVAALLHAHRPAPDLKAMTTEDRRTRRLRELPEKWISERDALNIAASKESDEIVHAAWRGQALGRQDCADELAAVLDTEGDRLQPCAMCGHESDDGDWYRICGACRWQVVADTEGDRPEPQNANELRTVVRDMRLSAIDRLCADVPKLWPNLSARTFASVVGALGEISITEAREALSRADTEGDRPEPAVPMEIHLASLHAMQAKLEAKQAELDKGCQCVCHKFPDHQQLQDALEALKWHQEQLAAAPAPAVQVVTGTCDGPMVGELPAYSAPAPAGWQPLTVQDIDDIIECMEHFVIIGDVELENIWKPYIDKLRALKAFAAPPAAVAAQEPKP